MALILDPSQPEFAASQDSQSRHPLVEILSQPSIADIPFDGQFLTSETLNEQRPNIITHSSARLCLIYLFIEASLLTKLKYVYTDVDRKNFTVITMSPPTGITFIEASLCELADGNIGIIYYGITAGGDQRLYYKIISSIGGPIISDTQICTFAPAYVLGSPFVIRLADNSYLLVYTKVDGSDYRIMKRTDAVTKDFQHWSAESEIAPGGLDSTHNRYNTQLCQIDTGEIVLSFDYVDEYGPKSEERTNIYQSFSSDNGATWGAAAARTNYSTYSTVGKHPVVVQKQTNQMHLLFHEQSGAIYMDEDTLGWCGLTDHGVSDMHFDPVTRKLYAISTYTGGFGTKALRCVLEIDVDTWTIDRCWNLSSVPAFHEVFAHYAVWWSMHHGERYYVPVSTMDVDNCTIAVINSEANTITNYFFRDDPAYGVIRNVSLELPWPWSIMYVWVDFSSKRLYVTAQNGVNIKIGYIDLTQVAGMYTWNEISTFVVGYWEANGFTSGEFLVIPEENYLIFSFGNEYGSDPYIGELQIRLISDGGLYKDYKYATYPQFPYHGLHDCVYLNGKIYGAFTYEDIHGQVDYRGLCEINPTDDTILFYRPTWATLDDYRLRKMIKTADGRIIMACQPPGHLEYNGITIFNPSDGSWILYTSDNLPGLTPDGADNFTSVAYDEENEIVFGGTPTSASWDGLVAFSINGYLKRAMYKIGTYSGSVWSFGTTNALVQGLLDYEAAAALDPGGAMYAFWTNQKVQELSIKWDKENSEFDLSPYLLRGEDIELSRKIDGTPASLSFAVSEGHLFDPHNSFSLWSMYLKKFRKLNIRWGEKISGLDYWQQAGVFFITESSIGYERPKYPTMLVKAEDRLAMWEIAHQIVTEFYETYPEDIMKDILTDMAGLTLSDIDLPTFDNRAICYIQWIEQPIKAMIEQICERFGYYPRIDVDGKFSARKISDSNAIDHIYNDLTKIIDFSPDDSFSDWTNRVIIKGEGRDFIEVLYAEEPVGNLSGAAGWWHKRKHYTIWYSPDHSRTCRYPRMEVIESVRDGPYFMKDGSEWIVGPRSDEKGFIVCVDGPNLIGVFITAVIIYLVLVIVCAIINGITLVGPTIAIACWISTAYAMFNLMSITGTQGLYQYNFYAQPVGKVRQSFQSSPSDPNANDEQIQEIVGMVIAQIIEDPLCYTIAQCQQVANFEMMVVELQRRRVKFSKMADLRDEDGDTIQIPHPITNQMMKTFITDLTRKMRIPSSPDSDDGYFLDEIEGWKIS